MSEQGSAVQAQPETDDIDGDLRNAIQELKIETPQEARVVIDKPERPRDEEGKFVEAPKEAKPKRETLKVPEPKAAAPAEGVQVDPGQQIPVPSQVKAPEGWKGELKAKFGELPEWAQQEIMRRETDAHKALTKQDEERQFGRTVMQMATPYLPTIRAEGATPEKAFQDYLQTAHVLRSGNDIQKAQSIAAVIGQFKVNPNILLSILQNGNVNSGGTVQPAQFNPVIESLQQRIERMEQERQQEIQQRQLQETQSLQGQIEEFSSKPGHEHFDRVRTHMGVLLENGIATDLEDAYNRAVYADPEIRSSLLAAQTQAENGKRLTELKATTERAKSAAVSITGSPGGARPLNATGSVGSIEDDLRAAMSQVAGRV